MTLAQRRTKQHWTFHIKQDILWSFLIKWLSIEACFCSVMLSKKELICLWFVVNKSNPYGWFFDLLKFGLLVLFGFLVIFGLWKIGPKGFSLLRFFRISEFKNSVKAHTHLICLWVIVRWIELLNIYHVIYRNPAWVVIEPCSTA